MLLGENLLSIGRIIKKQGHQRNYRYITRTVGKNEIRLFTFTAKQTGQNQGVTDM